MNGIKEIKPNTYKVLVPRGIRYLSQWQDFRILPLPHILDKQIPGCGFTEYCLTNHQDLVLCSPRKLLLENKYDQHKEDIYYVINSYEKIVGPDRDITKDTKDQRRLKELNYVESDEIKELKHKFYVNLKNEIGKYISLRRLKRLPFKIIVTYDSFHLVKQALIDLQESIERTQFVIDEFQSIFTDATFKSSTELNYITSLKGMQNLCFVSATPMIEKYLRQVDIFKDLPYYELDWESDDPMRVKRPKLTVRSSKAATTTAKEIINSYLSGEFDYKFINTPEGQKKFFSKEAVIYMNSVNNILNVIKACNLSPEQVNILCADTPENQSRVRRKLGRKFSIGKIPLKGQPHKTFTFCTRTVYLGADFYSTNAKSFIISDANVDTLAVDISLDLPQILGRQRLIENPWKDEADFYYKSTCSNKTYTRQELDDRVKEKLRKTNLGLSIYNKLDDIDERLELTGKYEDSIILKNYRNDYLAVNRIYINSKTIIKKPVLNNLVMIAEQRAFDIQQIDYADRFQMFSELRKNEFMVGDRNSQSQILDFFNEYEKLPNLYQKLKYLCEFNFESDLIKTRVLDSITEKHFKEYYETLGPEGCRSCSYNITRINNKLNINTFDISLLTSEIYKTFKSGEKYSNKDLKDILGRIYNSVGYTKTPVASDLRKYFKLREGIKIKDSAGKWIRGIELLNKIV